MIKKLYYIVELELQHVDGEIQETTGIKYVRVYEMINNVPNKFCKLEIDITDNTEIEIQEYLDDNGHGDEIFELIEL